MAWRFMMGGDDTFLGSPYRDLVQGGAGDDLIYGFGNSDIIVGGTGSDTMYGGAAADNITGGTGIDFLLGEAGNDVLYGGIGDDQYYHNGAGDGLDTINDDKNEAATTGNGGGTDYLFTNYFASDILFLGNVANNNLYITTAADMADNVMDEGIMIEDFYLGGNNTIEWLVTAENLAFDLTQLL